MMTILEWLGGKVADFFLKSPAATLCALVLAGGLVWQTGRIDGWPLVGGGLKAQIAGLQQRVAARDLADAKAQSAALAARATLADAANDQARLHAASDQAIQTQIQTVIRKVPVYVSEKSNGACVLPWGAIRLLDAAASGADIGDVAAAIAPGQPDDAASDVSLSEAVALLAADLGIARQNADQLGHLERVTRP
jgi:hypothetical protein